jgi:predicted nucleic acid-binding protein
MAKIVVDANVIISAAFGGKPLEAVVRALEDHEVYLSKSIHEKIQQLLTLASHVSPATHVVLSRDPKDDHYLSLCKETGAEFLVTGDKDLLSISQEKLKANGILCKVVSPQEFLEYVS